MFRKRIITGDVHDFRPMNAFPKGAKFIIDGSVWTIREEIVDTDETWRRILSDSGTEEIVSLLSLNKDLESGILTFVE